MKACQSTRQEVAVYHFTKVTNVALLLFPLSVAMALLPTEATEFVLKECHFNKPVFAIIFFFYLYFFNFNKKHYHYYSVYSSKVCILHMFFLLSVTEKATKNNRNMNTSSGKIRFFF